MITAGVFCVGLAGGAVLGYWLGKRGKKELQNALDTIKAKTE